MTDMTSAPRLTWAHFSLAAIGFAWTLPFLQPLHYFPLPSFYSEWLAVALGLAALTWIARPTFWRAPTLPWAVIPLLGFIVVLVAQFLTGKIAYGGQVLLAGLYVAWAAALIVLGAGLRRAIGLDGTATVLAWFLAIGGVVGAVLALLQYYQVSDLSQSIIFPRGRSQVYGNLAQNNHFAAYSTLAVASLAYLHAIKRLHWAGVVAGAVPLVYVIGLSGSRSALLFFAVLLVLALAYAWRGGSGGRRLAVTVLLFIAAFALSQWLATVPALGGAGGTETVTQRLAGGEGSAGARSLAFRMQIAREAGEMFAHSPVLGAGWGRFPSHDFDYRALHGLELTSWPFHHAHNIVLQLLAETGLAGALLIAAAVALWAWGLRRARVDPPHWWLAAVIGVIATHSLVEHPLWFAYFLGIVALAMGLAATGEARPQPERAVAPAMMLLIAAGAIYAVSLLGAYRELEGLFARGAPAPGTPEFTSAVARAHRDPALVPYAELAIATSMGLDRDRIREKRDLSARVMRFAPISIVVYRHAMLLALEGERDAAERQLALAARVYPADLPAMIKLMSEAAAGHAELAPLIKLAVAKQAERRAALERR